MSNTATSVFSHLAFTSKALFNSPGVHPGSGEAPDDATEVARLKAENEDLWNDNHAKAEEIRQLTERLEALTLQDKEPYPVQGAAQGEVSEEAMRKRMERLCTPKADGPLAQNYLL